MNRRIAATIGLVGALVTSGVAWAASSEPNALLTEGYDPAQHNLVWGVAEHPEAEGSTAIFDCRIEGTYSYEFEESGKVVMLTGEGGVATYQPVDEAADPVPYGETGDECVLTVTNVEGPNGQVNHGSIVSSFVHALKDAGFKGIGCYVRIIAQSPYPGEEVGTAGEVNLVTHETTCGRPAHAGQGNPHSDAEEAEVDGAVDSEEQPGKDKPEGKGKPPWAGQGGGRP